MSNGTVAIVWSCVVLVVLMCILAASYFISNRTSTATNTQDGKDRLMAALQADVKSLLGLAQVLSLFGVTLQVCPPGPVHDHPHDREAASPPLHKDAVGLCQIYN